MAEREFLLQWGRRVRRSITVDAAGRRYKVMVVLWDIGFPGRVLPWQQGCRGVRRELHEGNPGGCSFAHSDSHG
ncbi:hypothetical protein GCM10014719_56870 [Planomonospora parontospora subsp. antibiotica]|nr:hypothetical protein GCM10014719_56870 [Planomonospora parontospora subsp. antibiotica]GII18771.1 hypothetical protein Ppa05_54970 [Planomonospora parontospora subsp. antibiotica]